MPVSKKPRVKKAATPPTGKATLPDRQAMQQYVATTERNQVNEAVLEAQNVMYDAWEQPTARGRTALAHKALGVSPLCADAYNLLAEAASDPHQAVSLFTLGLQAGELALGPDGFEEYDGAFWGFLETRPYMRARAGLAVRLIALGRQDEAIGHLRAMLRLNPNDNQGIRYLLLGCLLERGDLSGANALIGEYPDEASVWWCYGRLLIAFRQGHADAPETRVLVREALRENKHVVEILSGKRRSGASRTPYIAVGSVEEAEEYLRASGAAWRDTDGAVAWLVATAAELGPE